MARNGTQKRARRFTPGMGTIGYRIDPEEAALVDERAATFRMSRHGYARLALRNDIHRHDFKELRALLVSLDQKQTALAETLAAEMRSLRREMEALTRAVNRFMGAVQRDDS